MCVTGMIVKKHIHFRFDWLTDGLMFIEKYEPSKRAGQRAEMLDVSGYMVVRGVVNKFPDWIFRVRTDCSYQTSR